MNPILLSLHRAYADGIIHCDEFAEGIKGIKGLHPQYEPIILILEWYREECRSVANSFDKFEWDIRQLNTMAGYYTRLKEAVDTVVYPNVVEGTNL
jgi:hypothetical protein